MQTDPIPIKRFSWKSPKFFSIGLRDGSFALAQSLIDPYIACFDLFSENNEWRGIRPRLDEIGFVTAVTRQFTRASRVFWIDYIDPIDIPYPRLWLFQGGASRHVTIWEGTENEMSFPIMGGDEMQLVEKDIARPGPGLHPSGVYDRIVEPRVTRQHSDIVDQYEFMSLAVYPTLNERLLIRRLTEASCDPEKDLFLGRHLRPEYQTYFKLISGTVPLDKVGY